jgi:hypothetical protein
MAVTFGGSASLALGGSNVLSGEEAGNPTFGKSKGVSFLVGAVAPQIEGGGGYSGTFTCPTTGGTLNLADSTNICKTGAVGTIRPNQGYVITAVKKLRALYLENLDTVKVVTVTCPATLFLAGVGWVASQVVVTLQPLGAALYLFPAGSAVLTAGTNDALLFTSDAGTPTVAIAALFG